MEDPLVPAGGLLALIALGGYGAYRVVQRRRANAGVDSSFMDSRAQPDSFFGASGGQHIDTITEGEEGIGRQERDDHRLIQGLLPQPARRWR